MTPIMMSMGLVPAGGIYLNSGLQNDDSRNKTPATTVLRPVFAPSLMAADDSGDTRMGAEVNSPDTIVNSPDKMKIHLPLGMPPSSLVSTARLLSDTRMPLR